MGLVDKYLNPNGGWRYGYPIETNDELVGDSLAISCRLLKGVYISTEMDELSLGAKEFILWHEVGHIKGNHFIGIDRFLERSDKIFALEKQVEADFYVVSRVGIENAMAAIQEIYDRKKTPELKERLNRLRRMSAEEKL